MDNIEALQLIVAITTYCEGPGRNFEQSMYMTQAGASTHCFEKIWKCGHNVTDASVISLQTHNCITKHINGNIK
jgi:hypothetical protein